MADKKFFPGFGYYPGRYRLSDEQKTELATKFELEFSDEDFAEMESALDACHGAFDDLRLAPSPREMHAHLDAIRNTASVLWTRLYPEMSEIGFKRGDPAIERTKRDFVAAHDAATRIKFRWINGIDGREFDQFQAFETVLRQLPILAEEIKNSIGETLRSTVSERGTGHLDYLMADLISIARRHDKPERYSRPVADYLDVGDNQSPHSFIAALAYHIGQFLDQWDDIEEEEAKELPPESKRLHDGKWQKAVDRRPSSESALINQIARRSPSPRPRREKPLRG